MADNIDQYRPIEEIAEAAGVDFRKWTSPGPTSLAYMRSTALLRILAGPFGSGKTTTCLIDEAIGSMQEPRCYDGVRRSRGLVTRDSYRQLYKTCIPSWQQWFPPTFGQWSGGQDRPAEHRLQFMDAHGPVDLEVMFAAIPEGSIKDWLDGFEITWLFMNAMPTQPRDVLTYGAGRIGRWPPARMLPPERRGLVDKHIAGDANKTDVDHWFYEVCDQARLAEVEPESGRRLIEFFDQPGGMDPAAENLANLNGGRQYYTAMAQMNAHQSWWVNINVHNKWGPSRAGKPVYPEFDPIQHVAERDFEASHNAELCIGLDAGTHMGGRPAAVFFQVVSGPQVRVIDEVYIGRAGPKRFGEAMLQAFDQPHLRKAVKRIRAWCDPSVVLGVDKEGGEMTWLQIMQEILGITIDIPESNELHGFRIPTVAYTLTQFHQPGFPMFLLSPRCKILRAGFNSGYRYELREVGNKTTEQRDPEKNDYSHPHDALQHGLTGYFKKSLLMRGVRSLRDPAQPRGGVIGSPFSMNFKLK